MASKNMFNLSRVANAPSTVKAYEKQQENEKKTEETAKIQKEEPVVEVKKQESEQKERKTAGKPATKHLVSMRFDPVTVNRIKTLADEWGVTQTRVVEKLIDEAWIRGGRKAD